MAVRKIGNSWWVDFRHDFTRHRKRSPDNTRAGAAAYEANLRQRLARGEQIDSRPIEAELTFAEFSQDWFETYVKANNKPSEQSAKRTVLNIHLVPTFGHLRISAVSARRIEEYKAAKLASGLSLKTILNHLTILNRCLKTAVEWDLLETAPRVRWVRPPAPSTVYLTEAEVHQLLSDRSEPRLHEMALVAVSTGLRRGELLGLDWSDLDFTNELIRVRQAYVDGNLVSPKSNKPRFVEAPSSVFAALAYRRQKIGFVFGDEQGRPLAKSATTTSIRRLCRHTGVRPISWHALRHTFATHTAQNAPIHVVKELLGHSDIRTTLRYAHVAPSVRREAVKTLERTLLAGLAPSPFPALPLPLDGNPSTKECDPWATGGQRTAATPRETLTGPSDFFARTNEKHPVSQGVRPGGSPGNRTVEGMEEETAKGSENTHG